MMTVIARLGQSGAIVSEQLATAHHLLLGCTPPIICWSPAGSQFRRRLAPGCGSRSSASRTRP